MRIVLFFLLMLSLGLEGVTQDKGPLLIGFSPKTGVLLAHRETMSHLVQDRNNVFELEFSRQDLSKNVWSQIYGYPSAGGGIVFQDYGNKDVLGNSFTFFKFVKFPIYQSNKWGFVDFRIGNGLSYITKKYDKFENKKNIAIGSHINGYVNFEMSWMKHFNQFYAGVGIDFAHISNASLKTPNQGLNTLTGSLTLGYSLQKRQVYDLPRYPQNQLDSVRAFHKWHFHFIFGLKQNLPGFLESRNFGVASLQGLYRKNLSNVWDAEFGIDVVYNEANRWFYEIEPVPVYQAFLVGAYSGLSMSFYNLQLYFGVGVYGLNIINPAGWVYDRVGIRFLGQGNWNFSLGIKAHIGVADYLEWGLGYRL